MSVTENQLPTGIDRPSALLAWIDDEMARLVTLIAELEAASLVAAEDLATADVIRRHVILHPERFSPHERDSAVDDAQNLGVAQQRAEIAADSARARLKFCEAVSLNLRAALAAGELESAPGAPANDRKLKIPPPGGVLAVYQAVEAERLRIARDLHDGPAQVLADLVLKAEILERIAQRTPEALPAELEEFRSLVRNAVGDMRRFMFDLRPDSLDDLGLVATMRRFSSEYQDRTGIVCHFNLSGEDRRIGPDLEEATFRIIQEALNNVNKHSEATKVEVSLSIQPERVIARIKDDGIGFDVEAPPSEGRHLGLLGMKERAEALAGTFQLRSAPGKGVEIEVEFRPQAPAQERP
jgi:signal transduction histidine kinase